MPGLETPTRCAIERPDDRMLTVKEVAAILNISERKVYRMIDNGELPAYWVNGMWRVKKCELDEWLAKRHNQHNRKEE